MKEKMMVYCLYFLSFIFLNVFAEDPKLPIKRAIIKEMSTSVIIPCCGKHFYLLQNLLECYSKQTVLPDEIVISLSDAVGSVCDKCDQLEQYNWPFKLKIVRSSRKQSAGENRNIACAHACGDILICQDADDIPHPQRVELVKYCFEHYKVDHLIHLWTDSEDVLKVHHDAPKLDIERFTHYPMPIHIPYAHNGNICIKKEVSQKIKWEHVFGYDKDVQFNQVVYGTFKHKIAIKAPLIIYRNHLSSFKA